MQKLNLKSVSLLLVVLCVSSCSGGFTAIDTAPPPVPMPECAEIELRDRSYVEGGCLDNWLMDIEELNELLEDRQS